MDKSICYDLSGTFTMDKISQLDEWVLCAYFWVGGGGWRRKAFIFRPINHSFQSLSTRLGCFCYIEIPELTVSLLKQNNRSKSLVFRKVLKIVSVPVSVISKGN